GSVSGLIGTKGAVGAFVSSGENNGRNSNGEYAGGFVAEAFKCVSLAAFTDPRCIGANAAAGDAGRRAVCNNPALPHNTFSPSCVDYTDDAARAAFAETCRMDSNTRGCNKSAGGTPSGYTINQCVSMPFHGACTDASFAGQRDTVCLLNPTTADGGVAGRCTNLVMNYCDIDANKFNDGCNTQTAIDEERGKLCREGTASDTSGCGSETVAGGYAYTYCRSGTGLEDNTNCSLTIAAVLHETCTTNPWDTGCIATTYYSRRLALCEGSGDLPEGEVRTTRCPTLALLTCRDGGEGIAAPDPFHATCFATGNPFANARANLCSTGMKTGNDCNTIPIEAAVCASSGAYANPFAAFCGDETGTSTSATIPTVIQAALNTCTDTNMDADDGICENTLTNRTRLSNETCIVTNPTALFATQCDYTQFRDVEIDYCDEPTTTWETRCADVSAEAEVKMARDNSCLAFGKNAGVGNDCETRDNVREACNGNPYTPTGIGTDDADVTICTGTDGNEVNYSVARDACEAPATSFDATCNSQDNIGKVKMARDMACAKFGIAAGVDTGAVNDCATRQSIMDACTTASPFTNEGCDTATHITLEIRKAFCTNGTTDIFNPKCGLLTDTIDRIEGTNDARETACLNSLDGTPIDKSCETNGRVVGTCTSDPFTKMGCENVSTIAEIRRIFCTETDIFNGRCGNVNLYGATNEARRDACLADVGAPSDPSCATDALAEAVCAPDPFNVATPGCANLDKNPQYRIAYCTSGLNIFSDSCVDGMHGKVNLARDTECRKTGASTLDGNTCASIVSMRCIENPFEKTTSDTSVNLCVGDNYDTARETECRIIGRSSKGDCTDTVISLCAENPFQKITASGGTRNLCEDASGSAYADARKVLCFKTLAPTLAGVGDTCTTLVSDTCTANPFEKTTDDTPVNLCVDKVAGGTDYAGDRKAACLNTRPASDGLVGGVCYTLAHGSDGFCDGADATDNPYA
ncbi:MAG: hypothetical protein K8953_08950, partial [Proteobacteria bacterium]|nr:hypothetical protein [Pseudomonadota bacterium]